MTSSFSTPLLSLLPHQLSSGTTKQLPLAVSEMASGDLAASPWSCLSLSSPQGRPCGLEMCCGQEDMLPALFSSWSSTVFSSPLPKVPRLLIREACLMSINRCCTNLFESCLLPFCKTAVLRGVCPEMLLIHTVGLPRIQVLVRALIREPAPSPSPSPSLQPTSI